MGILKKFLDLAIFSLAVLLAFLLLFSRFLQIPEIVEWTGHWHPVVLHFPIVLIFITVIQYWRKDATFEWFLSISAFLTLLTAITGLLLRLGDNAGGDLILTHQWLGVSVTYILVIWYWMSQKKQFGRNILTLIQGILLILIVLTGHFGGMVTHGTDFLTFSGAEVEKSRDVPENPNIYEHIVQPILNKRCISCHNPDKSKGNLVLTDFASIMSGGESGRAVNGQEPSNSPMLVRISLPLDAEDHMPPADEEQLTGDEKVLLSEWIGFGASDTLQFSDLGKESRMYQLVRNLIDKQNAYTWGDLPQVSESKILSLSSNYVRILRMFNSSNALQVIVYPHHEYQSGMLSELRPIAMNIVDLNVSGLPLDEEEMDFIAGCENLEKLNLSSSSIGDEGISRLANLAGLRELKAYNTNLTDRSIPYFGQMKGLKDLYLYNTEISSEVVQDLGSQRNDIRVIKTLSQADEFKSILPSPSVEPRIYFFRDPVKLMLEHPLDDINLYYTLDGSEPDETSERSTDSLEITESVNLKFYAAREGWVPSPVTNMQIFRTVKAPDQYSLLHSPNSRYIGKGEALLFDLEKGSEDFGDSTWMAFREEDLVLAGEWDKPVDIRSVVLSSMVHTDPYLFPPELIVVKGGMERSTMRILATLKPGKLEERSERHYTFYECDFEPVSVRFIEIMVEPLQRIPMWHAGKNEKGWFFIDEIVVQE